MDIGSILAFLEYFGITLETAVPLGLLAVFLYVFLKKSTDKISKDLSQINLCIVEIQSFLKSKYKNLSFEQIINVYGQSNSPVILKNEFRKFLIDSGLDKEVQSNKDKLVQWLKNTKPETGIDAQENIITFVESGEVENYLNLVKYKQNLYLKGKTSLDAKGILTVYLFEILIPEVKLKAESM